MEWLKEFRKNSNQNISFYEEIDLQLSSQFFEKLNIDLNRFIFYSDYSYINEEVGEFLTGTLLFVDVMYPIRIGIKRIKKNNDYLFWWEALPIADINEDMKQRQQLSIFSDTIKIEILYPVWPNINLHLIGEEPLNKNQITESIAQFMESWNLEKHNFGSIHNIIYLEDTTDLYSMKFKIDFGSTTTKSLNELIDLLGMFKVEKIIIDTK